MGKTRYTHSSWWRIKKHPHVHGEDTIPFSQTNRYGETPPRAWGRQQCLDEVTGYKGNTPTCMGKTDTEPEQRVLDEKHPHVHGEDESRCRQSFGKLETPPRAWGRPFFAVRFIESFRNTPTCMGKTLWQLPLSMVMEKHPHVHGED